MYCNSAEGDPLAQVSIKNNKQKMATKLSSMLLVLVTTFLTSSAQILWKIGSGSLEYNAHSILFNYYILGGFLIYVVSGILLIFALRGGEVSVLYPIIATSYIWVTWLSIGFLHETFNIYKLIGVPLIIAGIASIGFGSRNPAPGVM